MNSTKPWHMSVTVWGAIVTIAASVLGYLNFHPDASWFGDAASWLVSLGTLIGGAVSLWGRLRATKQIANRKSQIGNVAKLCLLPTALCLLNTGCAFFTSPTPAYVQADRLTHDAVAPEYQAYVHSDKTLTADQIARRDRTVESWEMRLESAEAGVQGSGVQGSAGPAGPAGPAATQPTTAPASSQ